MPSREEVVDSGTRVFLRPLATPLPLGFLALMLSTTLFAVVELGWIPVTQTKEAALVAVVLTAPLQFLSSVMGYLARDPVAATGMAILSGTWAFIGISHLLSPPGTTSAGLGVLLACAGVAMVTPASVGRGKKAAAAVMALAGIRFAITGGYELTASPTWKLAAGAAGLLLGALALYAALGLELEGQNRRTILPLGRAPDAAAAVRGEGPLPVRELAGEPGVRPRL